MPKQQLGAGPRTMVAETLDIAGIATRKGSMRVAWAQRGWLGKESSLHHREKEMQVEMG